MTSEVQDSRRYHGPVFFERGFRPFFLGAAVFAAIAIPTWVVILSAGIEFPSVLSARSWHIHEMIFGYVGAVIAGFLLTAVPNWTGRLPVAGRPLAALFGLWAAGRVVMAVSGATALSWVPMLAAAVDAAFLVVLAAVVGREVAAGKNLKNLPICGLVSLLAVANIGFHLAVLGDRDAELFQRLAFAVMAILISLVGGRIVPSFSRNWLVKAGSKALPAQFGAVDKAAILISVLTLTAWVLQPETAIVAILFAISAVAVTIRLLRWRGWTVAADPLVLILHLGYAWLPVWFALMALHGFCPGVMDISTAMHALTAGAAGTMTIAVMTRASLGHSGRALVADRLTSAVYVLIFLGAVARVSMPFVPLQYVAALSAAGLLWSGGFALFVFGYGPMLLGVSPKR